MVKEANKKYDNITLESLSLYKAMCIGCYRKRKRPTTKGTVVRPIVRLLFFLRSAFQANTFLFVYA